MSARVLYEAAIAAQAGNYKEFAASAREFAGLATSSFVGSLNVMFTDDQVNEVRDAIQSVYGPVEAPTVVKAAMFAAKGLFDAFGGPDSDEAEALGRFSKVWRLLSMDNASNNEIDPVTLSDADRVLYFALHEVLGIYPTIHDLKSISSQITEVTHVVQEKERDFIADEVSKLADIAYNVRSFTVDSCIVALLPELHTNVITQFWQTKHDHCIPTEFIENLTNHVSNWYKSNVMWVPNSILAYGGQPLYSILRTLAEFTELNTNDPRKLEVVEAAKVLVERVHSGAYIAKYRAFLPKDKLPNEESLRASQAMLRVQIPESSHVG